MINYLRKSNLFKASKWVSRLLLLRRRICTLLRSPLTLWASLTALIWAADSQPVTLLTVEGRGGRDGPILFWQLGCPRWQWRISLAAAALSTHPVHPDPATAVWWQQMTVSLCPIPRCTLSNLTGFSQPPSRSTFSPTLQESSWQEGHARLHACQCVSVWA